MALYLLSYDISEKDHDYQNLWDFLKKLGAVRILYSEWAVPWANNSSALDLVNATINHVMAGDNLFACELFDNTPTCAWRGLQISDAAFSKTLRTWARRNC
jgi:hypothetical protein